ncbi:MAG: MBOAT family protein [Bacteroidetes bacterium]|nr:MAG: MBOAT family protein [Bacteroidota bacterium]
MATENFSPVDPSSILSFLKELFVYSSETPLLFNSWQFLVLFLLFFGGYLYLAGEKRIRTIYVILFSLFFYYKCSGIYFYLLILSTLIDFYLGHRIYRAPTMLEKRMFLMMSLVANLGILAYFKYTGFFAETLNALMGTSVEIWDIFLPVGISFYTFQTMSYSIDIYRGKLTPSEDLLEFAFFVTFFPQLVAGPIVRAADFIPQIRQKINVSLDDLGKAFLLICSGLFKKAVISDYIGINFVDRVFENPTLYSGFENLLGIYGYALQIYCDFSGYSDIAIGLGLLLGFRLPENFRSPYQAASIREFWRRWHISLSSWLRDYLYISLGGNRRGKWRTYLNLMITMLLGGLWHGASWKFVAWGGLHGLALAVERLFQSSGEAMLHWWNRQVNTVDKFVMKHCLHSRNLLLVAVWFIYDSAGNLYWATRRAYLPLHQRYMKQLLSVFLTFHFVCFCWIFFRAESFGLAMEMMNQIYSAFHWGIIPQVLWGYKEVLGLMVLGYLLHFIPDRIDQRVESLFVHSPMLVQSLTLALIIWLTIQTQTAGVRPFIYFQF